MDLWHKVYFNLWKETHLKIAMNICLLFLVQNISNLLKFNIKLMMKMTNPPDEPTTPHINYLFTPHTYIYIINHIIIMKFKIKNAKETLFIITALATMVTLVILISLVGKNLTYTTRFTPPST